MSAVGSRFSVIVPTLNEADEIAGCLDRAARALGDGAELLVVDGGSTDETRSISASRATVVTCRPGRGPQLASGARRATGQILVFLHADTWLQPGSADAIERALRDGATAGCFRLGFRDARSLKYGALAAAINARTRLFRTATGDQAIFATRAAYNAAGGFEAVPLFEDVRLVRALRRTGSFRPLRERVLTSARRWERQGFFRTIARHLTLRLRHQLGAEPRRLAGLDVDADQGPPSVSDPSAPPS